MPRAFRCLLILSFLAVAMGCSRSPGLSSPKKAEEASRTIIPNQDIFYNQKVFASATLDAKGRTLFSPRPQIIVVPHHLVAGQIIANLVAGAASPDIKTVFIIGPNHDDKSAANLATAYLEWQTALGPVATDDGLVEKMLADWRLHNLPEAFKVEHSLGAIMPYIRYYLPAAKVVPIILNSTSAMAEARQVALWLGSNLGADSLVIVSTDFSHYLTQAQASANDKITADYILHNAMDKLIALRNDYVDSPASLVSAMLLARKLDLQPKIIYHNNANDFSERSFAETTSYFGIIFN